MIVILKKIISAKFTIFAIIGLFGLAINLSSFMIYLKIFSPTFSSFLAFSTAVIFNYLCHGKFLWQFRTNQILKYQRFLKFYFGYSFSMIINVLIVYFFQTYVQNIILLQISGIFIGSLLNFFVSRFSYTGKLK
jgi:putative flippase GtrA